MPIGPGYRVKKCKCLSCGKELDGATALHGDYKPKPGDITVCISCGHIMAYGRKQTLRELTDKEMYAVAGNKDILLIQKARGMMGKYE